MPLLKRVRVLAVKIETSPGTAISLSGTDATINVFDAIMLPNIDFQGRDGQGSFSPLSGIPGPRAAKCTFTTEITGTGAGAVPTWASTLLPACGFVNSSGTFSPVSQAPGSSVKTVTIGSYENGIKKLMRGCVGTFKLVLPSGMPGRFEWEFTGIWDSQADVSILAPTYDSNLPIRYAASTTTIGAFAPKIKELSIDCGNTVILREDAGDVSGYSTALITNRVITGTIDPEASLVATYDPYGDWVARTQRALSATISNASDKLTVAAPALQITNVQQGDRGDNQIDTITFQLNRSSGDDELTLAFAAGP